MRGLAGVHGYAAEKSLLKFLGGGCYCQAVTSGRGKYGTAGRNADGKAAHRGPGHFCWRQPRERPPSPRAGRPFPLFSWGCFGWGGLVGAKLMQRPRRVISRTVNRKGVGARGRSNRPRFSIHGPQLHAIDQSILRENVGRHDDFIAWDDAAHAAQEGDGVFNGVVGVGGEWHEERLDGAE